MKRIITIMAIGFVTSTLSQLSNSMPASGPVGIGTMTPVMGKQLTVNGNSKLTGALDVDGDVIIYGQTRLNDVVRMPGIAEYAGLLDAFKVIVIDDDGNLTKINGLELLTGLTRLPEGIDPCVADGALDPKWRNGPYKLFSACPDVKVGVGTSNPTHQLTVPVGTTFLNNLLVGNQGSSTTAVINAFVQNHSDKLLRLGKKIGGTAEEIYLVIDNKGAMSLSNSGNSASITINNGTGHAMVVYNNAGNKIFQLQDDGLLKGRKMKLDQDTWADHVFNKNYPLMSLEKTKVFIKSKGHLPNVPNAEEIKKNGLDVGEMMKIQMQKIEELTLHVISLNERVVDLEAENKKLKNNVSTANSK